MITFDIYYSKHKAEFNKLVFLLPVQSGTLKYVCFCLLERGALWPDIDQVKLIGQIIWSGYDKVL